MTLVLEQLSHGGCSKSVAGRLSGQINWGVISKDMDRSELQCRITYQDEVKKNENKNLKKGPFTVHEVKL